MQDAYNPSAPLDRRTLMYVSAYVAIGHDKDKEEQELERILSMVAIRFSEELQRKRKREETD